MNGCHKNESFKQLIKTSQLSTSNPLDSSTLTPCEVKRCVFVRNKSINKAFYLQDNFLTGGCNIMEREIVF